MTNFYDIAVLGSCLLALLFPYVFYPFIVRRFIRPVGEGKRQVPDLAATVTVLIPAHNEGERVGHKIENVLALDYPRDHVQILVASDGSTDDTAEIARSYASRGVSVFQLPERRGKLGVLQFLLTHATGELVLFTDVGATLPENALRILADELADPAVAVAMPRYVSVPANESAPAEATYWKHETQLKRLEAERDMLLGAHGACYLMRRSAIRELPADTIHDDFVWSLEARADGGRVAYRSDLAVVDVAPERLRTVFERTARMAHGNLQMLWRHRGLLTGADKRIATSLIGHKLLKTLGPVWILCMAAWVHVRATTNPALLPLVLAGDLSFLLLLLGAAWRSTGRSLPKVLDFGVHALVAQSACLVGIGRFFIGTDGTRWRRPPESDLVALDRPALPPRSVRFLKRCVDIAGAAVALVLALPTIPFVALAIKMSSPGPVLYRQERVARDADGRPYQFLIWKFRTMRVDAESDGQAVWAQEDDPRVTRIGAFLRRIRFDEVPQLVQVLRGEMTLIGPRPERPSISEALAAQLPAYDDRLAACKPGITGWAQIHTGYDTGIESVREKLLYDFTYNAHLYDIQSYLAMEFRVITLTLSVLIHGRGAR